MKYLVEAIYQKLISIDALTNPSTGLLAMNESWNGNSQLSRSNSIIYDVSLNRQFDPIFVTFGFGTAPSIGKSRIAQLFVRVYDLKEVSSAFNLVKIKELIRDTLNDVQVKISREGKIEIYQIYSVMEQPVRVDEAFNLNFVELEFNIEVP